MRVNYDAKDLPHVAIIVPTKDKIEMLEPCINTLLTTKFNGTFEIHVVSNNTTRPEQLNYLSALSARKPVGTEPRISVHVWNFDYNWSKLNNDAVKKFVSPSADYFVFLNDDTRVFNQKWLTEMVSCASIEHVGVVGAKLMYPHGAIQHIGVVAHKGLNGHPHKGLAGNQLGYMGICVISHQAAAVTGACMAVSRHVYDEIGGFDEGMPHNFNDVAFCLEAQRRGRVNVVASEAVLQHFEGVTRVTAATEEGRKILIEEGNRFGARYKEEDPYWSKNLMLYTVQNGMMVAGLNYDMLIWKRVPRPWMLDVLSHKKPRVLVIGPQDSVVAERRDGYQIFEFTIIGGVANFINPALENLPAFDIRKPEDARKIFERMKFDEIIVTSINNLQPYVLSFITRLGIPIKYRPVNAEALCPQKDLKPKGVFCNDGWRTRSCSACIERHGSPFGYVNYLSWISEWYVFINHPEVIFDTSAIDNKEQKSALMELFFDEKAVEDAA